MPRNSSQTPAMKRRKAKSKDGKKKPLGMKRGGMALHPVSGKRMRNKSTGRDYGKEYANYQGKPEQIAKRSSRNKARAAMMKGGVVKKGDGKDVDHKNKNPKDNKRANLRAQSKYKNRSFKRNSNGGHAGSGKKKK
jgi:hypothetical protein|tara:strand:+ start:243 stop:650 length:408 start_codon:yes stop_codon:yes gene_type:complete